MLVTSNIESAGSHLASAGSDGLCSCILKEFAGQACCTAMMCVCQSDVILLVFFQHPFEAADAI